MAQQSTMESVKHYLQSNDFQNARKIALKLDRSVMADGLELIKNAVKKPEKFCEKCNKPLEYIFNDWNMEWQSCGCLNCQYLKVKETIKDKCESIMFNRGISKRYLSASLNDFPENYITEFKTGKSIYLYGSRGTGKTHFMAGMMKYEILNTEPAKYTSTEYKGYDEPMYCKYPIFIAVPELLLQIRKTFNKSESNSEYCQTESDIIEKYSNAEILYLDDLGTEKPSDWVVQVLYLLIDRRYSEMKRTIISSNLNLNEIADRLDDRISSRIAGMCEIIKMGGKDRRLDR